MDNNHLHCDKGLLIGHNPWDTPVCVPLSAYLDFSHQMDVRMRRLVACWIHLASPIARGTPTDAAENRRVTRR